MKDKDLKLKILNVGRGSGKSIMFLSEIYENKIADLKANCDLAIEGRDLKIMELEQQIEKMKCCQNCEKYKNKSECGNLTRLGFCGKWEIRK